MWHPFKLTHKLLFMVLLFVTFLTFPTEVHAEAMTDEWVDKQISTLNTDDIKAYWEKVVTQYNGFLPESTHMSFSDFLKADKGNLLKDWLSGTLRFLFHELLVNGKLLGTLILLTVFSMILQNIQNAFENKSVSKVAYAIVYIVLVILALNSFKVAISYTTDAISDMSHFLLALMPLILALMASSGGLTSVAFFHPIIVFLINVSGWLISTIVMPLLFLSALLLIVSSLSEHYKVTQLAKLLRNVGIGVLAAFFAVFLGVLSVQGAATAISDGLVVRTAKFVTGNFVPVIGRMFTDAADTVLNASALVKNTVGIAGLIILVGIVIFPVLKVFALAFIYNLASAILQPLGGGPIIECLSVIGRSMIYIFAALAIVSLMFFLAITIIIASGNLSLMVR
ncbi:stage III sporulation protein AE [Pullulanibacillus pueri]|uniref:Stage III sporulation protein AE n=1 Tax=Pullulanibacillus pueri TaxID=1437324 RepID=A0A8J2ZUU5_9BACL|nr:stage III sporulation protein AE [Pullulanibacillus pueri]MBM7681588.1 stage III sporulation protein AE [Pullulanibacillus pueri]GGH79558.1 stage III sporulation protein AE [Pullulanibacillus pueri]